MDNKLVRDVESYVDEVWEDVVADIARLVEVPSIADASAVEAGAPFGRRARGPRLGHRSLPHGAPGRLAARSRRH